MPRSSPSIPSLGIAPRPGGCGDRERMPPQDMAPVSDVFSGGWIFASSGDWDSGSIAFTISNESRDALLLTPGRSRRFPGMLWSLNTLSGRGKPSDSRTFLRVLPDCIGNTTERLAAQFHRITRDSRGNAFDTFAAFRAFPPCCFPLPLSRSGRVGVPEAPPPEPLPPAGAIQRRVRRRTITEHRALHKPRWYVTVPHAVFGQGEGIRAPR